MPLFYKTVWVAMKLQIQSFAVSFQVLKYYFVFFLGSSLVGLIFTSVGGPSLSLKHLNDHGRIYSSIFF